MDEQPQALNTVQGEAQTASPTVEETTTVSPPAPAPAPASNEVQPEEEHKGKNAQTRIQGLVSENKSLKQRVQELTQPDEDAPLPQIPQPQTGAEVTADQYQQDVVKAADAVVQLRMRQQQTIDRINRESAQAMTEYPELNPDNKETYNKELSEGIAEAVEAQIRANPQASVKKMVDKLMKPYKAAINKEIAEAQTTMAQQASQTAMRPVSAAPVEKSYDNVDREDLWSNPGRIAREIEAKYTNKN